MGTRWRACQQPGRRPIGCRRACSKRELVNAPIFKSSHLCLDSGSDSTRGGIGFGNPETDQLMSAAIAARTMGDACCYAVDCAQHGFRELPVEV
eukprot:2751144-Pleurochrysis_carterae.AAC.1